MILWLRSILSRHIEVEEAADEDSSPISSCSVHIIM